MLPCGAVSVKRGVGGQWPATEARCLLIVVIPRSAPGLPAGRPRNPHDLEMPVPLSVSEHRIWWHRGSSPSFDGACPEQSRRAPGARNDTGMSCRPAHTGHRPLTTDHCPLDSALGGQQSWLGVVRRRPAPADPWNRQQRQWESPPPERGPSPDLRYASASHFSGRKKKLVPLTSGLDSTAWRTELSTFFNRARALVQRGHRGQRSRARRSRGRDSPAAGAYRGGLLRTCHQPARSHEQPDFLTSRHDVNGNHPLNDVLYVVAVEQPGARGVGMNDDVVRFAGAHGHIMPVNGNLQIHSIGRYNDILHPVSVHRMHLITGVPDPEQNSLPSPHGEDEAIQHSWIAHRP